MKPNFPQRPLSYGSRIIFHFALLGFIYFFLGILCYPVLINADFATSGDESYHFRQILEFMEGRFFLYYDNVTYAGILEGLSAIPFFWLFGVNFLAFKIPSILYFGLFIWSSFVLARMIQPAIAWIWLVLLLLPSTVLVNHILTLNYCNSLTSFLANLVLIYFYKYKTDLGNPTLNISLFGFFCGLSIYVYSYFILYLFPITILICLTHPKWEIFRSRLKWQTLTQVFHGLDSPRAIFVQILDWVIFCFLFAIAFAYTFGGFGLDIAGVTLLQINNLYKPVLQCIGLVILRFLVSKNGFSFYKEKVRSYLSNLSPDLKKVTGYGTAGFLLGMSPRIVSILSGEISRGGQGLDMDFLPTKMIDHAVILFTEDIPESLDLRILFQHIFADSIFGQDSWWYPALAGLISALIILATFSFIKKNKSSISKIIRLDKLDFNGDLFFILFPATLFAALIVTMNGPEPRYLAPLHWVVALYASFYLVRIQNKSKTLFVFLLASWISFYTINILNNYHSKGLMSEGQVEVKVNPLHEIIEFCNAEKISWIYTNYGDTGAVYILSKGKIFAAENTQSVRGKRWKNELALHQDFAILLPPSQAKAYINFLERSEIIFQKMEWKSRTLLWEFEGDSGTINKLRNLES